MPIFLSGVGGKSLLSNGLKVNLPELEHEGHSVVEPSGCITMIDESGIQLKNLMREKEPVLLLMMRMIAKNNTRSVNASRMNLTILTQQQNERLDIHYHRSLSQTDHMELPIFDHSEEGGDTTGYVRLFSI